MAKFYNPSISQWLQRIFTFKSDNRVQEEVANFIQPVINIEPSTNVVRHNGGTGTTTIYTTPSDKDFYITACSLSAYNSGATTASHARIQATIDGVVRHLIYVTIIPSTTSANNAEMGFKPIKIDRSTNIQIAGDASNAGAQASIHGYTVDTMSSSTA